MTPPRLSTVQLLAAIATLGAGIGVDLYPCPPTQTRPGGRSGFAASSPREPPPPREPTRAEFLAAEKRKRKAAKRKVAR
jgi:hypothetical protein